MAWRVGVIAALWVANALWAGSLFDDLVARAREAARTDRNAEASALFKQAAEIDSTRRREILRELADQMTYSGEAARAVPLYHEVIAAGGLSADELQRARLGLALAYSWSGQLDEALGRYEELTRERPGEVEAWLGRARVLSWLDRNAESLRVYTAVLLLDPRNGEALRNLGRVTSWRGRQREARQVLEEHLRANPGDAEALFLLAQADHWLGRPDRSRAAIDQITRATDDFTRLRDEIVRSQTSETRVESRASTQSDRLHIFRNVVRHHRRFESGLSQAGVSVERIDYEPGSGLGIVVYRPGLSARRRFSDAWEWNGAVFLDRIDATAGSDDVFTFDTWATWFPDDYLRFDISANRFVPDNVTSLEKSIAATVVALSSDIRPSELTSFNVRAGRGHFSDGNRSVFASAEVERRILRKPPLRVGVRMYAVHFDKQLGNGYFDPDRFLAAAATARIAGKLREGVWYGLFAAGGYEMVSPGDDKPQYSINGNLSWQFTRRFQVELRMDRFSSRQASSSGFARNTVELGLRYTPID